MKRILYLLLLLPWTVVILFPTTGPDKIKFEHLSVEHGLSHSTVYDIIQDDKGFMWFATLRGLNRYDGNTFKVYINDPRSPNSLSYSYVTALCKGTDDILWVGTREGGVNKLDLKTGTFSRYRHDPDNPDSIGSDWVHSIQQDSDGMIWIGTSRVLNKLDPQTGTATRYRHDPANPNSLSGERLTALFWNGAAGKGYGLWIGTNRGLNQFNPETGTFKHFTHDPGNPGSLCHNFVSSVYADSAGILWIGTIAGLNRFDAETGVFKHFTFAPDKPDTRRYNVVSCTRMDRSGRLWVGTVNALNLLNPETGQFIRYQPEPQNPHSLSGYTVHSIYEDRSGVIWIGTDGISGVNIWSPNKEKFTHYQHEPGNANSLADNNITCIHEDREGCLWLGTRYRGLDKWDRKTGTFTHYPTDPDAPRGRRAFIPIFINDAPGGILWVATASGLRKLNRKTGKFILYRHNPDDPHTLSSNYISELYTDHQGTLWVGTARGLHKMNPEDETFTRYRHEPDTPLNRKRNRIHSLYRDISGAIWIGTNAGLQRLNPDTGTFTHYRHDSDSSGDLKTVAVLCFHKDVSGTIWCGTYEAGLSRLNRETGTFTSYSTTDGLPDHVVRGILEDQRGFLWLSTPRGLSRFNPYTKEFRNYGLGTGIQSLVFKSNAFLKSRRGEMFFGGVNGINAFFPDKIEDNPHIPPIVISGLKVFRKRSGTAAKYETRDLAYSDELVLSYNDNIFSLDFAALEFSNPSANQYKYKLEGIQDDWIHLGNRHDITFSGLEPGTYTFMVTGSNNDGKWNPRATSLKITIIPPFWKTWWFKTFLLLVLALLVFLWQQARVKRLSLQLETEKEMNRLFTKHKISAREQEIVHLIMEGKSNKAIEDTLFISMSTVKKHVYNIYRKTNVNSRLELIRHIQKAVQGH